MGGFTPAITLPNSLTAFLAPDARAQPGPADRQTAWVSQQVLQHDPPGSWGSNRYQQVDHYTGMIAIAVKAYLDAVAAAKVTVMERKRTATVKKSLGIGHYVTDERYEPADPECPVCRVVDEPGGPDGVWEFTQELEFLALQYLLTGDAPAWCPPNTDGKPTRFFALPAALVQPLYGLGQSPLYPKGAYRYLPSGGRGSMYLGGPVAMQTILAAEEVGRFREMDPWSRSGGRSRLESLSKEIDVLEAITDSRWAMFDHGLQLDTVVFMPGVDQSECDKLQQQVEQKSGGARNARRFRVLGGGGMNDKFKLETYGQSAREMDYQQSYDQAAGVGLAGFRVPKSSAGLTDSTNYSGLYAEKQQLREYGLLPFFFKLSRFATQTVAKPWCEFPKQYMIEVEAPPLGDVEQDQKEREFAYLNDITTKNEYRKASGREPEPDGDVVKSALPAQIQQQYAPPPMPGMPGDPSGAADAAPGGPAPENPADAGATAPEAGADGTAATADPIASLLGDDAGEGEADPEDTPEAAQASTTQAALAGLGVPDEDEAPPDAVQKAVPPITKPTGSRHLRNEGEKWQVGAQWYTKKGGKIQKIGDPSKAGGGLAKVGDAGSAIADNYYQAVHDSIAKSGDVPSAERGAKSTVAQAWDMVKGARLHKHPEAAQRFTAAAKEASKDKRGGKSGEAWRDALNKHFAGAQATPAAPAPAAAPAAKPTARDLIAARLGKKPLPPVAPQGTPAERVSRIAGQSSDSQVQAYGKLRAAGVSHTDALDQAFGKPLEVAAAKLPAPGPVAKQTLASVSQWASSQADKHADRVAQHFGVSREEAHRILVAAITKVAEHRAKTGQTVGIAIKHGDKTVGLGPKKDPAEFKYPAGYSAPDKGSSGATNAKLSPEARPALAPPEAKAIQHYTTKGFYSINRALRSGGTLSPEDAQVNGELQKAFAKAKPFAKPVLVTRGMDTAGDHEFVGHFVAAAQKAAQSGGTFTMPGYVSTTTDPGDTHYGKRPIQMHIEATHGLDTHPYSEFNNEKELLLNHNSKFKVHKVEQKGNQWHVHLKQIPRAAPATAS